MKRAMAVMVPVLLVSFLASPIAGADDPARALPANGRILFTHCDDASGCQIYTSNPDGSAVDQVTHAAGEAVQGDWSPDGERITYVSFTSGDTAIWIINADGSHPRQLTPNDPDSDNFWPRFTPDGVWMTMETVGLSRPFPPMIGWILQPIARRVGRGSVGESMKEFAQAVAARSKLAP